MGWKLRWHGFWMPSSMMASVNAVESPDHQCHGVSSWDAAETSATLLPFWMLITQLQFHQPYGIGGGCWPALKRYSRIRRGICTYSGVWSSCAKPASARAAPAPQRLLHLPRGHQVPALPLWTRAPGGSAGGGRCLSPAAIPPAGHPEPACNTRGHP